MGTRSLTSPKIEVKLSATLNHALTDGSTSTVNQPAFNYLEKLTSGVAQRKANRAWQSIGRTLYNGQSEVIDLYDFADISIGAGDGLDALGQSMALESIVAIAVENDNTLGASNGALHVEPDPVNGFTALGTHNSGNGGALGAQGVLMKAAVDEDAMNVTDGSNHRLRLTAVNGEVTYSMYLLGRTDDNESSSSSVSSSSVSSSSSSSSISTSSSSVSTSSISTSSSSISTSSSSSQSESSSSSSSSVSTSSSSSSSSLSSPSSVSTSSSSISTSSISTSSSSISTSSSSSSS